MKKKEYRNLNHAIEFAQVLLSYHTDDSLLHFQQVKTYTKILITYYNRLHPDQKIDKEYFSYILLGAELHDIGKISIPDDILTRNSGLSSQEYERIKQHTIYGTEIIRSMDKIFGLGKAAHVMENVCRYHHERYDGSGYPEGLVGDAIPFEAQLVSISEVYAALTEENYHHAMTHEEAIQEITSGRCGAFNPALLECLLAAEKNLSDVLAEKDNAKRLAILQRLDITHHSYYWKCKRVMDVLLSLGIMTACVPVFLVLMLAIVIDDPKGGPFYKQIRLGRHHEPFYMYKFRTMCKDADKMKADLAERNEKDGPAFKMADDPRVTRMGSFLRKTGLDELPQFLNVLKGDMSIVGPRPPLPEEVEEYTQYQDLRLSVTPGITCTWQIQPNRDDISFEEWMDMDIDYIATRSLVKDFLLIVETVPTIIGMNGR